jgi:hypothetical protein
VTQPTIGPSTRLVDDLPEAAPALRDALLSLASRMADVVNGRPSRWDFVTAVSSR